MSNITIGRYGPNEAKNSATGRGFSAWIEGCDDNGAGWIFWLDETGRPAVYFPNRDETGAVLDPQIELTPVAA